MEIGRHVMLAIAKHQERGAKWHNMARECIDRDYMSHSVVAFMRGTAALEYATARKLMGVEE